MPLGAYLRAELFRDQEAYFVLTEDGAARAFGLFLGRLRRPARTAAASLAHQDARDCGIHIKWALFS
jgi:hypothetical protein